jgi:hypothetical protein
VAGPPLWASSGQRYVRLLRQVAISRSDGGRASVSALICKLIEQPEELRGAIKDPASVLSGQGRRGA